MKHLIILLFCALTVIAGCGTAIRNNYILLIDNSLSIQPEVMERYISVIIGEIVPKLGKSDCITIQFIDECSMTQSERVFQLDLSKMDFSDPKAGLNHEKEASNRKREEYLRDSVQGKLREIILTKRGERKACGAYTDIINALRSANSLLEMRKSSDNAWKKLENEALGEESYEYQNNIIIFSDMVNENRDGSFDLSGFGEATKEDVQAKVQEAHAGNKLPDLKGCNIFVFGATATADAGTNHNTQIENVRLFWEQFFKDAGATVKAYGYDSQKEIQDYLMAADN